MFINCITLVKCVESESVHEWFNIDDNNLKMQLGPGYTASYTMYMQITET